MRKHSFNHLLIVLACYDLLFIVCSIPVHTSSIFDYGGYIFANLYSTFFYPMTSVSFAGSIYMTMAITVERYLAVCHPHRYREINSTMKPLSRVLLYTIPVATFSIIINIPKFLETKVRNKTAQHSLFIEKCLDHKTCASPPPI